MPPRLMPALRTLLVSACLCSLAGAAQAVYTSCSAVVSPRVFDSDSSNSGSFVDCARQDAGSSVMAWASTEAGTLKASASTHYTLGAYGYAEAQAELRERIRAVPYDLSLSGTQGTLFFNMQVSGLLDASGDGNAYYYADVSSTRNGRFSIIERANWTVSGPRGHAEPFVEWRGLSMPVIFNEPVDLKMELAAVARSPSQAQFQPSLGGHAGALFGASAYWGGISAVLDATGRPVPVTIFSDSGVDLMRSYVPTPVPEPGTLALWAAGALALSMVVWRRRRRAAGASGQGHTAVGALGMALLLGPCAAAAQAAPVQSTVQLGCAVAGLPYSWQSASRFQTGDIWECFYDGSYAAAVAVQRAEATALRPEDGQDAVGRVGARTSVFGNFGQAHATAALAYRIYVPELDRPPFEPDFIPVELDWYANYETDAFSEAGFSVNVDNQQKLNDSWQGGNTTSSGVIPVDIPAAGNILLGKSARCASRIVVSLTPISARCSASADPVPSFDQARFDATWGDASFPLAQYYAFSLSPVPEPGRAIGTLAGLAALLGVFARRRRRCGRARPA